MQIVRPIWETEVMARKRESEYAKMEAAFNDLGWPVPTPQSFHHFTLAHQVDRLVTAQKANPDLGFIARLMALCSLPRTNPGNRLQYVRRNGPYTLGMTAGVNNKLPYGNLPRLLLAWVSTEAVRTQSRELILGRSLSEFMRKLDIKDRSGSPRGDRTRLRNQMKRLFSAHTQLIHEHERGERFVSSAIADRGEFWWDPQRPDEPVLWDSKIELGEKFFQEIIGHPVPLDMNILKAIRRSSLGLDLYMWLTYRTFALKGPVQLRWHNLYRQLGVNPAKASDKITVRNFRADCLRELKKIKLAWSDLSYTTAKGMLILSPSKPSVPPRAIRLVR